MQIGSLKSGTDKTEKIPAEAAVSQQFSPAIISPPMPGKDMAAPFAEGYRDVSYDIFIEKAGSADTHTDVRWDDGHISAAKTCTTCV